MALTTHSIQWIDLIQCGSWIGRAQRFTEATAAYPPSIPPSRMDSRADWPKPKPLRNARGTLHKSRQQGRSPFLLLSTMKFPPKHPQSRITTSKGVAFSVGRGATGRPGFEDPTTLKGAPNKEAPHQTAKLLCPEGLAPTVWKTDKSVNFPQKALLHIKDLPPSNAKNKAAIKGILSHGSEVALSCMIWPRSMGRLWVLGHRFKTMSLFLMDLEPEHQVRVFQSISPCITSLNLDLEEPIVSVLETIATRLRSLRELKITYSTANDLVNVVPVVKSLRLLQIVYPRYTDGFLPFTTPKPFQDTTKLWFGGVEFHASLEQRTESIAPRATHLTLINTRITKPILDLHFSTITHLRYEILQDSWADWAIASGLHQLRNLTLALPNGDYPTSAARFPQVCSLTLVNVARADASLWRWISRDFPTIGALTFEHSCVHLVPGDERIPLDKKLSSLLHVGCDIAYPLAFYLNLDLLAPNLETLYVPVDCYEAYATAGDENPTPFEIFPR